MFGPFAILLVTPFHFFTIANAMQQFPGDWPTGMPPINTDWTGKLLDGASIPNLPVTTAGNPVWDTSDQVVSCIGNPNYWAITYDDGPG